MPKFAARSDLNGPAFRAGACKSASATTDHEQLTTDKFLVAAATVRAGTATAAAEGLSDFTEGSDEDSDAATVEEDVAELEAGKKKTQDDEEFEDEEDELIAEEVMKKGGIEWKLVKMYAKACTYRLSIVIVLTNTLTHICVLGSALWLKHWIGSSQEDLSKSIVLFLGVYAGLTLVLVLAYLVYVYLVLAVARIRASEFFHRRLLDTIVQLPMR